MKEEDRKLDKFYTNRDLSKRLINFSIFSVIPFLSDNENISHDFVFLDPCAGDGSFFDYLPEPKIGFDIDPPEHARERIHVQDFLSWYPRDKTSNFFIISNFPFGKNSSLAVKFLNHASSFCRFICCILPKTFEKDSIKKRIKKNITLVSKVPLEKDSFFFKGKKYDVPCNFYIFRREEDSEQERLISHKHESDQKLQDTKDFMFVKNPDEADFAFQRVGNNAGKVSREGLKKSKNSHYFIKILDRRTNVMEILNSIDWSHIKNQTAGNPSISKIELLREYNKHRRVK